MRRKLFPITMLAVALLLALGRCAPTVETPPPPPVPTPAVYQAPNDVGGEDIMSVYPSIDVLEVNA